MWDRIESLADVKNRKWVGGLGMVLELQYFLTKATVAKLRTASITHSLWMYQKCCMSLSAGNSGLLYMHNVCK